MNSYDLKFSCIIPVYDGDNADYFARALYSITSEQTAPPNQLIVVLDGPVNESITTILHEFEKTNELEELIIHHIEHNSGLANALNEGLKLCKYELIARMDADDISVPNRFMEQLKYFSSNPCTSVLGGQISEFNKEPLTTVIARPVALSHTEIVKQIKWRNPIRHPTVMFRKSLIDELHGYPLDYPEDHILWVELLKNGAIFANLNAVLVHMRTNDQFFTRRGRRFLKGELKVLKTLYKYRMIGLFEYIVYTVLRTLLRNLPIGLLKRIYSTKIT